MCVQLSADVPLPSPELLKRKILIKNKKVHALQCNDDSSCVIILDTIHWRRSRPSDLSRSVEISFWLTSCLKPQLTLYIFLRRLAVLLFAGKNHSQTMERRLKLSDLLTNSLKIWPKIDSNQPVP